MQGISNAPTAPGMVVSTAAADAAAGGAGDVSSGSGGSLFGAILAGQLKGRTIAGSGMDLAALVAGTSRRHGGTKEQTDETLPTQDVLAGLLAAAGIHVAAFVPQQPSSIADSGRNGDALSLTADSLDLAGTFAKADERVADGRRLLATNSHAGDGELTTDDALDAQAAHLAANPLHTIGQGRDDGQSDLRNGTQLQGEDFAANGKNLSAVDATIRPLDSTDIQPLSANTQSGTIQANGAIPTALPLTQPSSQTQANIASTMEIPVPVNSPAWGEALGNKMVWMSGQGNQVAELRLDPPHLGPLEVRLTMNNDQASVSFVSHHPAVREAIESAMPRLREMLADNGIMLGNTSVGAESFQQQQQASAENARNNPGGDRRNEGAAPEIPEIGGVQTLATGRSGNGLVDMFV
jgi:flagellar hook-length control protein FliK